MGVRGLHDDVRRARAEDEELLPRVIVVAVQLAHVGEALDRRAAVEPVAELLGRRALRGEGGGVLSEILARPLRAPGVSLGFLCGCAFRVKGVGGVRGEVLY